MEDRIVGNRYRIVRKIGSGGMAEVFLAVDEVLGREVAVKILHKQFSNDPEFVERFKREAQSAANLNHPNIVSIYDRGAFDGTFYIAMELLEGENLKDLILREAPMPAERITEIAVQICSALQFAHKNGVIHRDIKPQNIIVSDGHVKVTDFGIARATSDSQVTRTGTILGTAHYLSPEQAQGHQVVEQSDIYSLGIVLYEMATGLLPFKGENPIAVALKHVNQEPNPPRKIIGTIPEGLNAIILKALSKDLNLRYSSASEMKNDLERLRDGLQPEALSEAETALLATQVIKPSRTGDFTAMPRSSRKEKGKGKKRRIWLWLAPLIILLLAVAAAAFAYYELSKQSETAMVPSVVGLDSRAADLKLKSAGFVPKLKGRKFSDQFQPGVVISQDPAAGENLKVGITVSYILSKGQQVVSMPDLVGMQRENAEAELSKRSLKLGNVSEEYSNRYGAGEVSGQTPAAGQQVNIGSSVDLIISKGTEKVRVPGVIGMTTNNAISTLESKGFVDIQTTYEFSSRVSPGIVIEQNPSGGTRLAPGSQITIVISKGRQKVSVPGVIGFSESGAKAAISSAGLKTSVVFEETTSAAEGTVISQVPAAGEFVLPGSVIRITIAQAPPPHEGTTTSP